MEHTYWTNAFCIKIDFTKRDMTEKDSKEKPEFNLNLDFPMVRWYRGLNWYNCINDLNHGRSIVKNDERNQRNAKFDKKTKKKNGCEFVNNRISLDNSRKMRKPKMEELTPKIKGVKKFSTGITTETNRFLSGFSVVNFTHFTTESVRLKNISRKNGCWTTSNRRWFQIG